VSQTAAFKGQTVTFTVMAPHSVEDALFLAERVGVVRSVSWNRSSRR
jgi:hypothetical protein